MQENSSQRIEPEAFAPANTHTRPSKENPSKSLTPRTGPALPWVVLIAFLALALLVLLLPLVRDDEPKQRPAAAHTSQQIAQAIASNSPQETPWADAQLLKARRDTQEVLAELLGVQQRLESTMVADWAATEFAAIISGAEAGDNFYQGRQFDRSLEKYTEALGAALKLDASIPDVARAYQLKGRQLLEQNLSDAALAALEMSNLLMPDMQQTTSLIKRARARDSILLLMDKSTSLARDAARLEEAKRLLSEALVLDAAYSPASDLIARIDQSIVERDFRAQMSRGFRALGSGHYQQATEAFQRASGLKPDHGAPREALQQVESARLTGQRQANLNRALELEADEQWEAALATYDSLLKDDDSLTAARLGKLRSGTRFKLDADIEQILARPLSLQSESKWQAASKTLADAQGIIDGGTRLNAQIEALGKLLLTARTPVVLKLNSDGQTSVEIYRVGKLGIFVEQAMNLNPGKYVIVGQRNGYQDVRVELSIDGSKPEVIVPIVCTVTI